MANQWTDKDQKELDLLIDEEINSGKEEYYFPSTGQNRPPSGFDPDREAYYGPLEESIPDKELALKKAKKVTDARPPEAVKAEIEKVAEEFRKAYNKTSSRNLLTGGPTAQAHMRAAEGLKKYNYIIPENMPLEEAFRLAGKTSQGKTLQNIRDRYDSLRTGVEDVRTSLLSKAERTQSSLVNQKDREAFLRSLPGIDKVAWDDDLGSFIVRRNGRYGLTDEKGASIGDVLDVTGPALDALLTVGTIEGGPLAIPVKKGVKGGAKKALRTLKSWMLKMQRSPAKKGAATGSTEAGLQFVREKGAQSMLLPEDAPKASTKELGYDAFETALMSGIFQGVPDQLAKTAKGTVRKLAADKTDDIALKGARAREQLQMTGLTKGEADTSLARAEATLSKMPFSNIKDKYIELYEQVADFAQKHTEGRKTLEDINDHLDEIVSPFAKQEARLTKAQADAATAASALTKSQTKLKEGALDELQKEAERSSEKLIRGNVIPEIRETLTQRLTKEADLATARIDQNPAMFFNDLSEAAIKRREDFQNKSAELYDKVREFPASQEPIFDTSLMKEQLETLKRGLRDEEGEVISGLSPQDMSVVDQILKAGDKQSLDDLVAFKQMIYNSIGNDIMFKGLDDKLKRDIGKATTDLINDQAEEGGEGFAKALKEANNYYSQNVNKFYNAGAKQLFLDETKRTGGYLDSLAKDVYDSGVESQMYKNLKEMLGGNTEEMNRVNNALFGYLIGKSVKSNKVDLDSLLKSLESMEGVDPGGVVAELGFDASALKEARKVVDGFNGSKEIDIDLVTEMFQAGAAPRATGQAIDVSKYLKIGAAGNDKVADELITVFGGKPSVPKAMREALEEVEGAKAAKLSADEAVAAEQKAMNAIANDDYFSALRSKELTGAESHKNVFGKVFKYQALAPNKLKSVVKNLEAAASKEGIEGETAKQLLKDIRIEVLNDLFNVTSRTPDILVGGKAIERMAEGKLANVVDPYSFVRLLKGDKEYSDYLKNVLGSEYSTVESLSDALMPTARRDAMTHGLGSLTGKTTYAQFAQTSSDDALKLGTQVARTFLMSTYLKGGVGVTKYLGDEAIQNTAKRVESFLVNPTVEKIAKSIQLMGRPAAVEVYRTLQAQYGAGDADEIWKAINELAAQYEPEFHGEIEQED